MKFEIGDKVVVFNIKSDINTTTFTDIKDGMAGEVVKVGMSPLVAVDFGMDINGHGDNNSIWFMNEENIEKLDNIFKENRDEELFIKVRNDESLVSKSDIDNICLNLKNNIANLYDITTKEQIKFILLETLDAVVKQKELSNAIENLKMFNFMIGDRVRVIYDPTITRPTGFEVMERMTGTVKELSETHVGVEFDSYKNTGFWHIPYEYLERIEEDE